MSHAHRREKKKVCLADFVAEQQALSDAGEFFVCVHRFFFLATKP